MTSWTTQGVRLPVDWSMVAFLQDNTTTLWNASMTAHRSYAELVIGVVVLSPIIVWTVCGNALVVAAVNTYRPLRKVPNMILCSLAVADMAVAVLVMPWHVVKFWTNSWPFGLTFCQIWTTCDILLCTSSILHLCAIAIDRYWAIKDPVNYANRRTKNFVLVVILTVWILSSLISVPPLFGWNDWPESNRTTACEHTTEEGFVIFSAMGSFYIPLTVMTITYIKIYLAARTRIRRGTLSRTASIKSKISIASRACEQTINTSTLLAPTATETNITSSPPSSGQREHSGSGRHDSLREHSGSGRHDSLDEHLAAIDSLQRSASIYAQQVALNAPMTMMERFRRKSRASERRDIQLQRTNLDQHAGRRASKFDTQLFDLEYVHGHGATKAGVPLWQKWRRRTKRDMKRYRDSTERNNPTGRDSVTSFADNESIISYFKEKEKINIGREKKAVKTLAIIMGGFVACWLPFFVLYIILPWCAACQKQTKLFEITTWLGYINSSLNPVIYTVFNTDFRKGILRIIKNVHRKIKSPFVRL